MMSEPHANQVSDITESKINWLLDIAGRLTSILKSESKGLLNDIEVVARKDNAVIARKCIASDGYTFLLLSKDPSKLLQDIIDHLRDRNSDVYRSTLNPINIMTKLVDQEYMLDTNGTRLCYVVKAQHPSNYLMKAIACKTMLQISTFAKYIDPESNTVKEDMVQEIHPRYDYSIQSNKVGGGRKKPKTPHDKKKHSVRMDVLSQMIKYVREDSSLAQGIIFVNDGTEDAAINILYTDRKHKESLETFLNELTAKSFPSHSCKCFLHAEFKVPYDFRARKHSMLMTDKKTKSTTYIANLYNIAAYMPVPCTKAIVRDTFIYKSHPLVKLMLLYIDMYSLECKTNAQQLSAQEKTFHNRMVKAYNEVLAYEKTPTWVGVYMEEAYDKIKYNMKMRMTTSVVTHFI